MNRSERRAAARAVKHGDSRNGHGLPKRCPPGMHAFAKITAIVGGKEQVARVVCRTCRWTFQQVMEESPEDLAMYRAFVAAEIQSVEHLRACPGSGSIWTVREAAL